MKIQFSINLTPSKGLTRWALMLAAPVAVFAGATLVARANVNNLVSFTPGTTVKSAELNGNFNEIRTSVLALEDATTALQDATAALQDDVAALQTQEAASPGPSQIELTNIVGGIDNVTAAAWETFNDAEFTYAAMTKIGSTITPTVAGDLALKRLTVPRGKYLVGWSGAAWGTSLATCQFRLYDGTNVAGQSYVDTPNGMLNVAAAHPQVVEYTTDQATVEWLFQAQRSAGSGACQVDLQAANRRFGIYMIPIE